MKKITALFLLFGITSIILMAFNPSSSISDMFLTSIITIESKGNPKAKTKDGSAGILQIKPVMVKEVNRICKIKNIDKKFTMNDRFDVDKSIEMFWIYQNFYNKNASYEKMARDWNGGPSGHKKSKTKKYWNKVNKVFVALKTTEKKSTNMEL